jgi:hypothetical protein
MTFNKTFVDDAPCWRVMQLASAVLDEKALRNSFVYYNNSDLWLISNLVV